MEKVLDLGCGSGNSIALFKDSKWFGVDIKDSPEGEHRTPLDNVCVYNGVELPYKDNAFDLVYSHCVFEHVRHPDRLLKEVFRVLKPNGIFKGVVSYLEPYHSLSIYNFTPYGLSISLVDAGFEVIRMKGISDGFSTMLRQLLNKPRFLEPFFNVGVFKFIVGFVGFIIRLETKEKDFLKLQFAGQIDFLTKSRG